MSIFSFHTITNHLRVFLFFVALTCFSIQAESQEKEISDIQFEYILSSHSGIDFQNKVLESPERNISDYDYFYNGGGVAIGDLNNDKLPDLVFTGNDCPNEVYINEGDLRFRKLNFDFKLEDKKWATGVTLVDINRDGFMDIYISYSGPDYKTTSCRNELYLNIGDETFIENAKEYGLDDNGLSTQAVFFDMDNDGDVDLWVLNHAVRNLANKVPDYLMAIERLNPEDRKRFSTQAYQNDGEGKFENVSQTIGCEELSFGLGISITDFDGDGWKDVFMANDFFLPDRLYINQQDGTFRDEIKSKMAHTTFFSMGCDAADVNNDGLSDLVVLDMTPADHYRSKMMMNAMSVNEFRFLRDRLGYLAQYMFNGLHINTSGGVMSDIGLLAGVSHSDWSWAPLLADFNNDGLKDLFISNGFLRDTKNNDWRLELLTKIKDEGFNDEMYFEHLEQANQTPLLNEFYLNTNGYQFKNATVISGLTEASFSNGAAYGDLDLDGDLDLIVNNLEQKAFLYKNHCIENEGGNYLRVKLKSKEPTHGSKLCIKYDGLEQFQEASFTRGFQSNVEDIVHFGISKSTRVDTLSIQTNDGKCFEVFGLESNRVHEIDLDSLHELSCPEIAVSPIFINSTEDRINPPYYHKENLFDDFKKEVLLPHKQSAHGPALAVGDLNGDGMEDFFVGGSKGTRSVIYYQNLQGAFVKSRTDVFKNTRHQEAQGALIFDFDSDSDLDIYVACGGGGDFKNEESLLQDLLYINDGKGVFTLSNDLPAMLTSTLSVQANDWDLDGDLDLFVGGRTSPGLYPKAPKSYLLENNKGVFVDVTETLCPRIKDLGMVTDSEWFDWDEDGDNDLVIVGEWMPITVFINDKGRFKHTTPIEDSNAWWNCIEKGDIDNDGHLDLLFGNVGLNNKFHPSPEKPLYLFANDFDSNGSLDIVLSKVYKDTLHPVRGKECSTMQMPQLQESHETFNEFASSNLFEIYGQENLKSSIQYQVETFSHIILKNRGEGDYSMVELPIESQFSSINDFLLDDFNGDGILDVLCAGNNSQTEVETTPYDASLGLLLLGNGDFTFKCDINTKSTGVFLSGNIRHLKPVDLKSEGEKAVIVAKNNNWLNILVEKKLP